ncbi:hypothetical protein Ddye_027034 [Dipteronia dyeriana]|uniref:TF-B3 domain-containing protein n=1 Tax=Dipteronia dyeriana TaxID=168575 RepID=A0AAD9WPT6_9ROSI|nr:hypothetical protein Ddye_027034 [Dipteronia dyeriana]
MAHTFNKRRVPEFFKVYLPEHSSESLLIPNSFVSFCNRLMPKNAVLSNHMGSLWHVIVDYIDGKVFFLNGWKKFVGDNSIESGDLLIFRYNGQCGFSVKVFGQDACEKIENKANGTSYMNKVKLEDDEEEKQMEEETTENDNEVKDFDDHDGDDNDDSDYEDYIGEQGEDSTKEEESVKNNRAGKQSVGNIGGSKKRDAVKVEGGSKRIEAEEEESITRKSRARKQSGGNNGGSKKMAAVKVEAGFKRTNPINIEEEEKESTNRKNRARKQSCGNYGVSEKMPGHMIRRGYKRTNDVPLEVVDVPKLVQPPNPFFIANLKTGTKKNLLFVPAKVLKLYQLKFPSLIFFRNKHGMQWPANVYNWKDGRILICGWNDFCRANHVSLDDRCICEFPQGNNQEVNVIDVHIVCNTGEGASRKRRVFNKIG